MLVVFVVPVREDVGLADQRNGCTSKGTWLQILFFSFVFCSLFNKDEHLHSKWVLWVSLRCGFTCTCVCSAFCIFYVGMLRLLLVASVQVDFIFVAERVISMVACFGFDLHFWDL